MGKKRVKKKTTSSQRSSRSSQKLIGKFSNKSAEIESKVLPPSQDALKENLNPTSVVDVDSKSAEMESKVLSSQDVLKENLNPTAVVDVDSNNTMSSKVEKDINQVTYITILTV